MSGWSVDPAGVLGVFTGVDQAMQEVDRADDDFKRLADDGAALLTAGGRRELAAAWEQFATARRNVPGELMGCVLQASQAVTTASVAVLTSDAEMADRTQASELAASWGIEDQTAYFALPGW